MNLRLPRTTVRSRHRPSATSAGSSLRPSNRYRCVPLRKSFLQARLRISFRYIHLVEASRSSSSPFVKGAAGFAGCPLGRLVLGLRRVALPPGDRGGAGGDEGSKGVAAAGASSPGLGYGLDTTSAISNLRRDRPGTRSDGAPLNFRPSHHPGSLTILAAIRRASSWVMRLAAG